jgi:two-component system phosphate regulon sensor histidine kinase PhoR
LRLTVSVPESLPSIQGDSFLIEQMLVNLLDNALKFTEDGEVQVSVCQEEAGWMRIEVSDTGIGIAEEHIPRLFERFYVVDKSRSRKLGGTGLGLSIVKHIVQSHGGTVAVESALGRGTRFTVRLPTRIELTEN